LYVNKKLGGGLGTRLWKTVLVQSHLLAVLTEQVELLQGKKRKRKFDLIV